MVATVEKFGSTVSLSYFIFLQSYKSLVKSYGYQWFIFWIRGDIFRKRDRPAIGSRPNTNFNLTTGMYNIFQNYNLGMNDILSYTTYYYYAHVARFQ